MIKLINTNKITPAVNYKEWEQEFSFMHTIIMQKLKYQKEFVLPSIISEKDIKDKFVHDQEMNDIYISVVANILDEISFEYLNYIQLKYFSSMEKLVEYVSELCYFDLCTYAKDINKIINLEDMKRKAMRNLTKSLQTTPKERY